MLRNIVFFEFQLKLGATILPQYSHQIRHRVFQFSVHGSRRVEDKYAAAVNV